jgi:molybdate transport system regulatory protein
LSIVFLLARTVHPHIDPQRQRRQRRSFASLASVIRFAVMPRIARQEKPLPTNRLTIRVDLASGARIGPGKIALLEAIERHGSISAAGRELRMSYRRAWDLVEALNKGLGTAVVSTATGGAGGGGATLTATGAAVVAEYRAIEREALAAAVPRIAAMLRPPHG